MADKDITASVVLGGVDGDYLPLIKCVCGEKFDSWDFVLNTDRQDWRDCDRCKRRMYFRNDIKVFEVVDDKQDAIVYQNNTGD